MASPTITFLDLPPKTFIGINLTSFDSSPNFRGVRGLPEGLHFIYTATNASLSIRHGRWLKIRCATQDQEIVALSWNTDLEQLEELDHHGINAQEVARRRPDFHKSGLVDYVALRDAGNNVQKDQTSTTTADKDGDGEDEENEEGEDIGDPWPGLSSHITPRLLHRILSRSNHASPDQGLSWTLTSISSAPSDTEQIPGLTSSETEAALSHTQTLDFLPIDLKQTWPDEAVGRARTDMARDRSWYLSHLITQLTIPSVTIGSTLGLDDKPISQARAAKELLGELQFSFLMVLCLANYSCLEQWKRVLSVLFTCRTALVEAEGYLVEAITVLRMQLRRTEDVEGGLFELADEEASAWLRKLIKVFKHNVEEVFRDLREKSTDENKEAGVRLEDALGGLEKWLNTQYGWEDERNVLRRGMVQLEDGEMVELQTDELDEDEETGEYAPVVVEM